MHNKTVRPITAMKTFMETTGEFHNGIHTTLIKFSEYLLSGEKWNALSHVREGIVDDLLAFQQHRTI